jgi:hypothetical protein
VWLSGYATRDEDREPALELAGSDRVRTVEDDMCTLEVDPCRTWTGGAGADEHP